MGTTPVLPDAPAGPSNPSGPVGPVLPVRPAGPCSPIGPEPPVAPAGPGSPWILARIETLLGLHDDPSSFAPPPGPVAHLARRGRGMHLVRLPEAFDVLCQVVLQQRVSFRQAARSHRRLVHALDEPSPGPPGLRLPLAPRHWLRLSSEDFRRAGVDGQRASRLRAAARQAPAPGDGSQGRHRVAAHRAACRRRVE